MKIMKYKEKKQIKRQLTCAIYRIYAIRKAKFAGEEREVTAEQIGGDFLGKKAAFAAKKEIEATGKRVRLVHVGGHDS